MDDINGNDPKRSKLWYIELLKKKNWTVQKGLQWAARTVIILLEVFCSIHQKHLSSLPFATRFVLNISKFSSFSVDAKLIKSS